MLAIYTSAAFSTASGVAVAANADVTVRRKDTGALADLYEDEDGLVDLANPFQADSLGRFEFYAAGLARGYDITVDFGAETHTVHNQAIGTLAQFDAPALGADGYPLVSLTSILAFLPPALGYNLVGGYLAWSVSGNVLTVAIKTWAGNDPSGTEPVFIAFRSATAGTGSLTYRKITAATSISINDTALIGTANGIAFRLWCVAFDDAGTIRLALINCVTSAAGAGAGRDVTAIFPLAGWGIASSTLEADGSDSAQVFYSAGAAVTSKAYAALGFATWETGLATAGTWSAGPTRAQLYGPGVPLPGQVLQRQRSISGALQTTAGTAIPLDDTIPQSSEGDEITPTRAITPTSAANALAVEAQITMSSAGGRHTMALFQDATANALAAKSQANAVSNTMHQLSISILMLAQLTTATTFKVRAGANTATAVTINGEAGARLYGGVVPTFVEAVEIMG